MSEKENTVPVSRDDLRSLIDGHDSGDLRCRMRELLDIPEIPIGLNWDDSGYLMEFNHAGSVMVNKEEDVAVVRIRRHGWSGADTLLSLADLHYLEVALDRFKPYLAWLRSKEVEK